MNQFQRAKIGYLTRIGLQYWASAHILWRLDIFHPAMYNLYHAVELHLRALWLTENFFDSEQEMIKGLIKYQQGPEVNGKRPPHDIQAMINKLTEEKRTSLSAFTLVNPATSRFGEGEGAGYSQAMFTEVDNCIKQIRKMLGASIPRSHYQIIDEASATISRSNPLGAKAVKLILRSRTPLSPRKRQKQLMDAIRRRLQQPNQ